MTDESDKRGTALATLRHAIEAGESFLIVNGKLLPERELSDVLSVSRRGIREALDKLENEGLVFRRQGQGTFIQPSFGQNRVIEAIVNKTNPVELMEVRREIEPPLAKLAALRASPADFDVMRKLVQKGASATNADDLDRFDRAFHAKVASCVRNDFFYRLFEMVDAVRAETHWVQFREDSFAKSNRELLAGQHFAIIDALESRNPGHAEAAMRAHLATITQMIGV